MSEETTQTPISTFLLAVAAVVLWFAYFAICCPPGGAPFIYADF